MKEWLVITTEYAVTIINAMALVVILIGTVQAFSKAVISTFSRSAARPELRDAYLHYARWLVAGLTFQLAADVIETSIAPSWEDIGRLGAIALIRTFLNYFLERDMMEALEKSVDVERPQPR